MLKLNAVGSSHRWLIDVFSASLHHSISHSFFLHMYLCMFV